MRRIARVGMIFVLLTGWAATASATDYVVTKTADTADGVCDADCSLREAIIAANAHIGADRVVLGNGLTYTLARGPADAPGALVAATGDLDITDALTLDGNGSVINAAGLDRALDIQGAFGVIINDLTITGGVAAGFLSLGGGVYIRVASVTFNNSTITANSTAVESGARDDGGGIAAIGTFNAATGVPTLAGLTLNNTTVSGNTGASGGGIVCVLCQIVSSHAALTGNSAVSGDGGAAAVLGNASAAFVTASALTNNAATRGGAVATPVGTGGVTITRARIVANAAASGGALYNRSATVTAANNWWGCNYGPGATGAGCTLTTNDIAGPATTSPYLVLRATPSATGLTPPGTITMTADLTFNSADTDVSAGGVVPDGITAVFASSLGIFAQPRVLTAGGKATDLFTPGFAAGSAALSASVDAQTATATVAIGAPLAKRPARGDLDGDGLPDLVVYRVPTGTWYWLTSSSGYATPMSKQWGNQAAGDVPFLADIDGDGASDLIVWRASTGTWYWLTSSTGYSYANGGVKQWGNQTLGDVPLLADMDGDGRADFVVWRASTGTFYWLTSTTGYDYASAASKQWGSQALGDMPQLGDFDGDGRADLAVWRASTGTWYWITSSTGYNYPNAAAVQWGNQSLGDTPFLYDVDGDGRVDPIVWRASTGTWYWLTSTHAYSYANGRSTTWGDAALGDIPLVADMDGDGKSDFVLWRSPTASWSWLTSATGYNAAAAGQRQWGSAAAGDVPMIK